MSIEWNKFHISQLVFEFLELCVVLVAFSVMVLPFLLRDLGLFCSILCRLFQVEYAIEAVKLGSTAVGIRTEEGVVLAVEKRLTSSLLEPSSVEKIMEVRIW